MNMDTEMVAAGELSRVARAKRESQWLARIGPLALTTKKRPKFQVVSWYSRTRSSSNGWRCHFVSAAENWAADGSQDLGRISPEF
ncbi:hypothetical protein R1flu_017210 [Riccia fluitans]|uniref:Uncharacterized protein n=1 Tax=Riccia fluitans TaxID=41844 RepID=A0ABD1XE16_9MARC